MIFQLLLFALGLTSLTLGADWLVTGAARVAAQRGVSPLMVGLTIVAFGTSAPELVVSSAAALRGGRVRCLFCYCSASGMVDPPQKTQSHQG